MDYMLDDYENKLIGALYQYINSNYNDFKEYEKGLSLSNDKKIIQQLQTVIHSKIECCVNALWVFKMGCEGHFTKMQHYIREQKINN